MKVEAAKVISSEIRTAVDAQARGTWLMALVAGLAAVVALGQLLSRHVRLAPVDRQPLETLGFTERQLALEAVCRAAIPAIAGVVVGVTPGRARVRHVPGRLRPHGRAAPGPPCGPAGADRRRRAAAAGPAGLGGALPAPRPAHPGRDDAVAGERARRPAGAEPGHGGGREVRPDPPRALDDVCARHLCRARRDRRRHRRRGRLRRQRRPAGDRRRSFRQQLRLRRRRTEQRDGERAAIRTRHRPEHRRSHDPEREPGPQRPDERRHRRGRARAG